MLLFFTVYTLICSDSFTVCCCCFSFGKQPTLYFSRDIECHMSMSPSLFFTEFSSCYLRFTNRPSHTIIPHQQACGYLTPPLSDRPYWRDESICLCHPHSHYKEDLFHRSSHYRGGQAGRGELQVPSISAE